MNTFQILSLTIAGLALFGGIITVYTKMQIEVAKIYVTITFFQKDLDRKELAICKLENENKKDHEIIMGKIDKLIDTKNGK